MMRRFLSSITFSFILFLSIVGFFSSTPAYAFTISTSNTVNNLGLVGYWTFDGKDISNGAILDKSGNGNTGYPNSIATSTFYTEGKIGQAGNFDGVNDKINIGTGSQLDFPDSTFSYSFWFYNTSTLARDIISNRSADSASHTGYSIFSISGTSLQARFIDGTDHAYAISTSLTLNRWYHVTVVWNREASTVTAYVNGVQTLNPTSTAGVGSIPHSTNFMIGSGEKGPFPGKIDDVRIYNRALSIFEVNQLYKQGASTRNISSTLQNTNGLVGYWTFDGKDISNGAILDKSGNGNTGYPNSIATSTFYTEGKIGQAGNFDGVNDYININTNSGLPIYSGTNPYAVSFWVKGNPGVLTNVYGEGNTTNLQPFIRFTTTSSLGSAKMNIQIRNDSGSNILIKDSTSNVFDNKWHLITWIDNAGAAKLYVDNVLDSTNFSYTPSSVTLNTSSIGALRRNTPVSYFAGGIDDVRIYNRALSASEINALYQSGVSKLNTSSSNSSNNLNSGLVAYYTFDGKDMPAGHMNDVSGNGNTGYMISTATSTFRTEGKIGQAGNFDGVDDAVTIFNTFNAQSTSLTKTISAWAMPTGTTSGMVLCIPRTFGASCSFSIVQTNGNWEGKYWATTVGTLHTTVAIVPNKWIHLTLVQNGSVVTFYINGVPAASASDAQSVTSVVNTRIGSLADGTSAYFRGRIDDVRIYNRALSASEVTQLYNMGR